MEGLNKRILVERIVHRALACSVDSGRRMCFARRPDRTRARSTLGYFDNEVRTSGYTFQLIQLDVDFLF
jgi:hypothetical protein